MADHDRMPSSSDGLLTNRIAHAGGRVDDKTYSNSMEAVESSIARGFTAIEVDVVQCRDGFIVAHDGMESSYGVKDFGEVHEAEFNARNRVYGRYTPLNLDWLAMKSRQAPAVRWVIDAKVSGPRDYGRLLQRLAQAGLQGSAVPQVYNVIDAAVAIGHGFEVLLFATWKHYAWDSLSAQCLTELDRIRNLQPRWLGVTIRHQKWRSETETVTDDARFPNLAKSGVMIYFHAIQPGSADELAKCWGIFTE
jgi:hypothetical protein